MILDEIAKKTKERVAENKSRVSINEMKERALACEISTDFPFLKAMSKPGMNVICEVKKASPSKGVIAADFPYIDIAREYEEAGADAISVLTEPYYFQGSDQYFKEIRSQVTIPMLRKDFTVDEYMIYEAKLMGADCILLICSILSKEQLKEYSELAASLGMSCLVETHDEGEVAMALETGSKIIGVNNRNLKDFTVDIRNSITLRRLVPESICFISESGMKTREDIVQLEYNKTNGVLIGETFMRSANKREALQQLLGRG